MIDLKITDKALSIQSCIDFVTTPQCGGINVFVGTVRGETKGKKVTALHFEAYESMALLQMKKIGNEAILKWPLLKIVIHHRVGKLKVGEIPVVIAVSAAHRAQAFEGCSYLIDRLKETVPIWKKEIFEDGAIWVSAYP
jgi:molybdopterin synthase catalytic subunit